MLPSQVKIGAMTYSVQFDSALSASRKMFGEMCPVTQQITIDANTTTEQQEETLLHEIIEAVNNHCELGLEHHQIQTLGFMLHQVLRENCLHFGATR